MIGCAKSAEGSELVQSYFEGENPDSDEMDQEYPYNFVAHLLPVPNLEWSPLNIDITEYLYRETIRPVEGKMVALTFDDGPGWYTVQLLDILEEYDARATFFVQGDRISENSAAMVRAVELGNEVAGHSWTHANFTGLEPAEMAEEILRTSTLIERYTGVRRPFYRAPFGAIDDMVEQVSRALGYAMIGWTMDILDWYHLDSDKMYHQIVDNVRDGDIILMHDIYESTIIAMEHVIPWLIEEGYTLVTISELLYHNEVQLVPGKAFP